MAFETSAVPNAIDGLLVLIRGSAVFTEVDVYDGLPPQRPSNERYVCIAVPTSDGQPGVEGTQEFVTMPARERDEEFSLHCEIYSRSGGTDTKIERDRAFTLLGGIEALVRPTIAGSDITLGGAVLWCSVTGRITYTPLQVDTGCVVRIQFDIACRARLSGN